MSYEYVESPNKSSRKGNQVEGLIAHFTVGEKLNGTVRYMCNKIKVPQKHQGRKSKGYVTRDGITYYNARAAAHYVTGRIGRTVMLAPENMAAWHAGSSTTKPKLNGRGSLNLWTIGHELCNWGPLRKDGDTFYTSAGGWTYKYKGPEPVRAEQHLDPKLQEKYAINGKPVFPDGVIEYWEPYPDEQVESVIVLWKEIVGRYNLGRHQIAGHEEVDPTRKCDPGAAFPWDTILSEVFPKKEDVISDLLYTDKSEDTSDEVKMAERVFDDDRSAKQMLGHSLLSSFRK